MEIDEPMAMDHQDGGSLLGLVAKAADVCLPPWRHAVRNQNGSTLQGGDSNDCELIIEARDRQGQRCPANDLDLEIYRSGDCLNLMLSRRADDSAPVLWHGSHPVWMDASNGERCDRPSDGMPLESLCRRLRALLNGSV